MRGQIHKQKQQERKVGWGYSGRWSGNKRVAKFRVCVRPAFRVIWWFGLTAVGSIIETTWRDTIQTIPYYLKMPQRRIFDPLKHFKYYLGAYKVGSCTNSMGLYRHFRTRNTFQCSALLASSQGLCRSILNFTHVNQSHGVSRSKWWIAIYHLRNFESLHFPLLLRFWLFPSPIHVNLLYAFMRRDQRSLEGPQGIGTRVDLE